MNEVAPISAIVTTYNEGPLLRDALESVLTQNAPPAQVIVIDDGSREPTADSIVEDLSRTYDKAILLRRIVNSGPSAARNEGLALATQEYVAYLDGDDVWLPDHLAQTFRLLRSKDARYSSAYASHYAVEEVLNAPRTLRAFANYDGPIVPERLGKMGAQPTGMPFYVHRRQALLDAGGFDPEIRVNEDLDLMARVAKRGHWCVGIAAPTVVRRVRSASATKRDPLLVLQRTEVFLAKAQREALLPIDEIRQRRKLLRLYAGRQLALRGSPTADVVGLIRDAFGFAPPTSWREIIVRSLARSNTTALALNLVLRYGK